MIGLLFIVVFVVWLVSAFYFGRAIPRWLGLKPAWSYLFVPLGVVAPFADEIVGDIYMTKLCNFDGGYVELIDINTVKRAAVEKLPTNRIWYFYPIDRYESSFIDIDAGRVFGREISYENESGIFLRTFKIDSSHRNCNSHAKMTGKGGGMDGYKTAMKIYELLESGEVK